MNKKKMSDMPLGQLSRVKDFLPPPNKLVMPKATIKVTLNLQRSSVEFLKRAAAQNHVKYQQMIRELVDRYVQFYSLPR